MANNLHKGGNWRSWKPPQQGGKKTEKKEPRPVGDLPLSFGEFIRAHAECCFVCYVRNSLFQQDHRRCPAHKAVTEAYKKEHGSKKSVSAKIWEGKAKVPKVSRLMMVGTELAKKIREMKRAWSPKPENDKHKDKEKKGKVWWRKKGDAVSEVGMEEDTQIPIAC